jgi:hypothetical protein
MKTGVRLTQLNHGEPILGTSWSYENKKGVEAAQNRLDDLFYMAKYLGFTHIIDTINPTLNSNGELSLKDNGLYGDEWSFSQRMNLYRQYSEKNDLTILLEINFPTQITENNLYNFADYFINLASEYSWVKNWQIMINPEEKIDGEYKCSPKHYNDFIEYISQEIKKQEIPINIGGPGCFNALVNYANNNQGWLKEATKSPSGGFLKYLDFFSIQGKQNTNKLNYKNFPTIIDKIYELFNKKHDVAIPIYSTYQGWKADPDNNTELYEQSYYELREILNCYKKGVVPFIKQLVDEYPKSDAYKGNFDKSKLHYGLLYYHMSGNYFKPACTEYKFILLNLLNFNSITYNKKVCEYNENIDSITLMNKDKTKTATILWPKKLTGNKTVVLKPHPNRKFIFPSDDNQRLITEPKKIEFNNYNFMIVYEDISKPPINIDELETKIDRRLDNTEKTLSHLINLLPDNYNKEVTDVNFYKLLRSLALEISDTEVQLREIEEDLNINSVNKESLYDNFGVLVGLKKKPEWDYDKYKRLIKGVTKSLLDGPTPESITEAIKLFTNFDVDIHELYKTDKDKINPNMLNNTNPEFSFVVEIEKPITNKGDQREIIEDTNYIIDIIKPAHTIHLIVVTLTGDEDYRSQYLDKHDKPFKNSDEPNKYIENNIDEGIYGWKEYDYPGKLETASSGINNNSGLTNSGILIGPRYVLHDKSSSKMNIDNKEQYENEIKEKIYRSLYKNINEIYEGIEEQQLVEYEKEYKEHKFGIDLTRGFKLNGGKNGLKTLNNFHLLGNSKLRDEVTYREHEHFFKERYIFRNTLKSLMFNNPPGFNSKFRTDPDKPVKFDFDLKEYSFKKKVIKLDNGNESYVNRLKEEGLGFKTYLSTFFEPEGDDLHEVGGQFEEDKIVYKRSKEEMMDLNNGTLNNSLLGIKPAQGWYQKHDFGIGMDEEYEDIKSNKESSFKKLLQEEVPKYLEELSMSPGSTKLEKINLEDIEEKDNYGVSLDNNYDKPDSENNSNANLPAEEWYRPLELKPEIYHIHKKLTHMAEREGESVVKLPRSDLFTKSTQDKDSLVKVYVNGTLQPYWTYKEITSSLDSTRATGIRFLFKLQKGDIVTILYLKDREVIIGNYPITTNDKSQVIFGEKNETYKTIKEVNEGLGIKYGHSEIYEPVNDQGKITDSKLPHENEEFNDTKGNVTFKGDDHKDNIEWNTTNIQQNLMYLNQTPLLGINQEKNEIKVKIFEQFGKVTSKITKKDVHIMNKEFIMPPKEVCTFTRYHNEKNIMQKVNIDDNNTIIGYSFKEEYKNLLESSNSKVNIINKDNYNFKNEAYIFTHEIPPLFDSFRTDNIKDIYKPNIEIHDIYNKYFDKQLVKKAIINNKDKYSINKINYKSKITFEHFNENIDITTKIKDKVPIMGISYSENIAKVKGKLGILTNFYKEVDVNITKNVNDYMGNIKPNILEDKHTLQNNFNCAFRFGSNREKGTRFNLHKFVHKPILNYEDYGAMVESNINLNKIKNNIDELGYVLYGKCKNIIKKIKILSYYTNENYKDKYGSVNDKQGKRKVKSYNHDSYFLKATNHHLKLFRVDSNNNEEVLRDSSTLIN